MVTTEGYMFFPPLLESDGETQKLKKLNHHSFFGNPFYHWLSGHCKKNLVLFAQDLIVNCLILHYILIYPLWKEGSINNFRPH
jgi:hypothetical protein